MPVFGIGFVQWIEAHRKFPIPGVEIDDVLNPFR